ncbi:MAG: glucose-1-phosphate thymidylyltransferase [Candidatus Bipolaricaulia bacterium]
MKAVVLCAGEGTRLRPLTYTTAKHLIPVANRPVIHYTLDALREAGITDIGIVVSPNVEAQFKSALGDGSPWGVRLSYIRQSDPKGLAHAIGCAREFVGDDPFLVYLGDNLLEQGLTGFVRDYEANPTAAGIMLTEVDDPTRFGVARLDDDRIAELVEKPSEPPSNLAIVGVYQFDPSIFEAIDRIEPSWRGELEITDAIQTLIDDGETVRPHQAQGWWKDAGKPEDMVDANRLLLDGIHQPRIASDLGEDVEVAGRVAVARDVKVHNSVLRGPLAIGAGSVIRDAFVGPYTSIDDNVHVSDSEIEHSIVMAEAEIEGIRRVDHSLIGRNVHLRHRTRPPDAYRFVIGDDGEVDLT